MKQVIKNQKPLECQQMSSWVPDRTSHIFALALEETLLLLEDMSKVVAVTLLQDTCQNSLLWTDSKIYRGSHFVQPNE